MKMLTYGQYVENAKTSGQWKSYQKRWCYHEIAIELAKSVKLSRKADVLELGALGNQIVPGSHTMDWTKSGWEAVESCPTYDWDAKVTPWPIEDKQYKLFIALRVFHHLFPNQEDAFREALRIADNVIICCPEKEIIGEGIPREKFFEWYGGEARMTVTTNGWGIVYLF